MGICGSMRDELYSRETDKDGRRSTTLIFLFTSLLPARSSCLRKPQLAPTSRRARTTNYERYVASTKDKAHSLLLSVWQKMIVCVVCVETGDTKKLSLGRLASISVLPCKVPANRTNGNCDSPAGPIFYDQSTARAISFHRGCRMELPSGRATAT